ncbi:MAG: cyclase family protein [Actinomycetota bacterium]
MRFDHAQFHLEQVHHGELSRRDALKLGAGAAVAAAGATAAVGLATGETAGADDHLDGEFGDEMFDVEMVLAEGWGTSKYGPDDQRGTFNEVTPNRTYTTMARMRPGDVRAYQLGEEMFNGFPAFPADPPRTHDMFLLAFGFDAGADFAAGGGIQSGDTPLGPNLVTGFEERFAENFTFQIGTQIDGLGHVGTGDVYYNGHTAQDLASPTGLTALGNETMGPIATRGVVLDIVGMKVASGATDDFFIAPNGEPVLRDNYRITIDDIENALFRQRINLPIRAGDIPIFHTGWTHLVKDDPVRYLTQEPGIYLAEARYLADRDVALIASDTWGLEVLDPAVTGGNAFPCHQELFGKFGCRIGESFVTDAAIADNVFDGLLVVTPENVPGATCGSSAPTLLGPTGRAPRS